MRQHNEFKIYDDCGHVHPMRSDPGTIEVDGVGLVCEDGYQYSICFDCHTHDGDCHEDSPTEQAWPCDARVAMDRAKELERVLRGCVEWMDEVATGIDDSEDPALFGYHLVRADAQLLFTRALAGEGENGVN